MEVSSASPALAMAPAARRGETLPAIARPRVAVLRPGMGLALPSRLPFERWLSIGMQLSAASTSVAWCLGDWLAFGERAFAGHYRQAVEATCPDYQTLRNYERMARRFGMSRRRDKPDNEEHLEHGEDQPMAMKPSGTARITPRIVHGKKSVQLRGIRSLLRPRGDHQRLGEPVRNGAARRRPSPRPIHDTANMPVQKPGAVLNNLYQLRTS